MYNGEKKRDRNKLVALFAFRTKQNALNIPSATYRRNLFQRNVRYLEDRNKVNMLVGGHVYLQGFHVDILRHSECCCSVVAEI